METMERWEKLARPPASALKEIRAGRLKGKSDINPQWRYRIMTEVYGPCGEGWKFDIRRLWTEPAPEGQVFAFAEVELRVRLTPDVADIWSDPIPGVGGHFLVIKESNGLHANDEAFKMATTDALGTAMKMLGVAADVYSGLWDGSKYKDAPEPSRWENHADNNIPPPVPQQGAWTGENKSGRPFRGTGLPVPQGWFTRVKENRAKAVEEIGGARFGVEKNPAGKWEVVEFVDPPATQPAFDPNDDINF